MTASKITPFAGKLLVLSLIAGAALALTACDRNKDSAQSSRGVGAPGGATKDGRTPEGSSGTGAAASATGSGSGTGTGTGSGTTGSGTGSSSTNDGSTTPGGTGTSSGSTNSTPNSSTGNATR